jgi:hypothetical protein
VITGLFFDWGFKLGFLGIDAANGKATVWDDGSVPFSTTNLRIIAATIVKLLTDPIAYEDSKNKYIYTASHTTTQAELLEAAEKATGKKFDITTVHGAQVLQEGKEKVQTGDLSGIRNIIQAIAFAKIDGKALTDYREFGIFNDKYGINDISVDEDVKNLIASQ